MFHSRENLLRRRISKYPVINVLSLDPNVVEEDPAQMPSFGTLRLDGMSLLSNFLYYLRSQRFEQLVPRETDALELDLPCRLVQDAIDVANGGMLIPDIKPLEAEFDPSAPMVTNGCLLVSIGSFADPSSGYVLRAHSAPLGENSGHDKYFCLVFFLKHGSLDVQAWKCPYIPQPGSQTAILAPFILSECQSRATIWAALTDGVTTALIKVKYATSLRPALAVSVETTPLQFCVARLIAAEADQCDIFWKHIVLTWEPPTYLGVLYNQELKGPDRFTRANFDIFTIQRDRRYWDEFIAAHKSASDIAIKENLTPGSTLHVRVVDLMPLRRSPVPFPDIPEDTLLRLWCDSEASMRPRDTVASALFEDEAGSAVTFLIADVLRVGKDLYSQTYSGFVDVSSGSRPHRRSGKLCLKLYDERFFKIPQYEITEEDVWIWYPLYAEPCNRVPEWTTAEDMAQREWAAYERLRKFQGFVVPHAYGIFEFELPGGHRAIGLLMEFIEGKPLHEFVKDLPKDKEGDLITDIRHAVRVLRYAQIHQRDWNTGNILISPPPQPLLSTEESLPSTGNSDISQLGAAEEEVEKAEEEKKAIRGQNQVVLIDFAFAFQHFFLQPPTPVANDLKECRRILYELFDFEVVLAFWFDQDGDDNEW